MTKDLIIIVPANIHISQEHRQLLYFDACPCLDVDIHISNAPISPMQGKRNYNLVFK